MTDPRPPHQSSRSSVRPPSTFPLRADLVAANIFQRATAAYLADQYSDWPSWEILDALAFNSFKSAAAFIAESRRRDPNTGELIHPTDGLPKDEP